MEYSKHLLKKEKVELGELEIYARIFEMLSNQQDFKNVIKKAMTILNPLTDEVSLLSVDGSKFQLIGCLGKKESIELYLENKTILKQVRDSKKPYFGFLAEDKEEGYHVILPILSKEQIVGILCIHQEQEITCWKEIYAFLHLMSAVFKYYEMINVNKNVATKDIVTSLYNYRHFQDQLDIEIEKTTRYYIPLTLVVIDIEDFRMINDKLGYEAGDEALKMLGKWINQTCRRIDMPARLDADVFAILLSNTDSKGGEAFLERLMIKIRNHTIKTPQDEFKIRIKSSITPFETHLAKEEFLNIGKQSLS